MNSYVYFATNRLPGKNNRYERFNRAGDDLQEYRLDGEGYLADGQNIIALLKNRADQVELKVSTPRPALARNS